MPGLNEPLPLDEEHLEFLLAVKRAAEQAIQDHHDAVLYRTEADYWRKKYSELLDSSIKHNETMMGNMLQMVLECDIRPRGSNPEKQS